MLSSLLLDSASLRRDAADLVDAAARDRVIVLGKPPPGGRDLDLLVRPAEEEDIARQLAAAGFQRSGIEWVRFRDCSAHAVNLFPIARWRLPERAVASLYAEATPLAGRRALVSPSPRHELLVIAKFGVTKKKEERIRSLVAEHPSAWPRAKAEAAEWGTRLRSRRRRVHRPRPPRRAVVALSGLDGAGKSSQAEALCHALGQLGHRAEPVWLPLAHNVSVGRISGLARALLRRLRILPGLRRLDARAQAGESFFAAPGTRRRAGPLTQLWVVYVAIANALTHRRLARRAHVVVFDRYVLDSIVRIRYVWGSDFRFQRLLLRALSPKPAAAFFLDVPPEAALARKQDRWSAEELARQAELYREEAAALGVVRLDGERSRDQLCAEIAETVWRALR